MKSKSKTNSANADKPRVKLPAKVHDDKQTITIRIPFRLRTRGGRKLVLAPDGERVTQLCSRFDSSVVKALARAFRWRKLIEDGTYASIAEIAEAEKINDSYVGRILRLTLLAPKVVESLLQGSPSGTVELAELMRV